MNTKLIAAIVVVVVVVAGAGTAVFLSMNNSSAATSDDMEPGVIYTVSTEYKKTIGDTTNSANTYNYFIITGEAEDGELYYSETTDLNSFSILSASTLSGTPSEVAYEMVDADPSVFDIMVDSEDEDNTLTKTVDTASVSTAFGNTDFHFGYKGKLNGSDAKVDLYFHDDYVVYKAMDVTESDGSHTVTKTYVSSCEKVNTAIYGDIESGTTFKYKVDMKIEEGVATYAMDGYIYLTFLYVDGSTCYYCTYSDPSEKEISVKHGSLTDAFSYVNDCSDDVYYMYYDIDDEDKAITDKMNGVSCSAGSFHGYTENYSASGDNGSVSGDISVANGIIVKAKASGNVKAVFAGDVNKSLSLDLDLVSIYNVCSGLSALDGNFNNKTVNANFTSENKTTTSGVTTDIVCNDSFEQIFKGSEYSVWFGTETKTVTKTGSDTETVNGAYGTFNSPCTSDTLRNVLIGYSKLTVEFGKIAYGGSTVNGFILNTTSGTFTYSVEAYRGVALTCDISNTSGDYYRIVISDIVTKDVKASDVKYSAETLVTAEPKVGMTLTVTHVTGDKTETILYKVTDIADDGTLTYTVNGDETKTIDKDLFLLGYSGETVSFSSVDSVYRTNNFTASVDSVEISDTTVDDVETYKVACLTENVLLKVSTVSFNVDNEKVGTWSVETYELTSISY